MIIIKDFFSKRLIRNILQEIFVFLFRDIGTQTTTTVESSIEILKDAIRHMSSATNSKNGFHIHEKGSCDSWTSPYKCQAILDHKINHNYPIKGSSAPVSLNSSSSSQYLISIAKSNGRTQESSKSIFNMIPITLPAPLITRGVSVVPINETPLYKQREKMENGILRSNGEHNNDIFSSCMIQKILDYNHQHHYSVLRSCHVSLMGFDGITRSSKIDFCQDRNFDPPTSSNC